MTKPTFIESLVAGAMGGVKGMLILGLIGLGAGAILGGLAGAAGLLSAGTASGAVSALNAIEGAIFGGVLLAEIGTAVGAAVGAITGVIQSREGQVPDAQDLINMHNIAFAQGAAAAQNKNVSHESLAELEQAKTHFQDQLAAQQKNTATMRC